jgi:hypothetical protein
MVSAGIKMGKACDAISVASKRLFGLGQDAGAIQSDIALSSIYIRRRRLCLY